jgi:hypothetical protein
LRKNASFFVRALPSARCRARRHFEEAIRFAQKADLAGLGFVCKAAGQAVLAQGYMEEARAIAEGLGANRLITRIDRAF